MHSPQNIYFCSVNYIYANQLIFDLMVFYARLMDLSADMMASDCFLTLGPNSRSCCVVN
jgi:hypothetical protein